MEWKEIKTQADADKLLEIFGDFHDACLREAHLWTGHWVSSELNMSCPDNLDNRLRLLIQRQYTNPSAIELLFEELIRFNLVPFPEGYCSIIYGATLLVLPETIIWSPDGQFDPDECDGDKWTWVSARKLRWRQVDWLGKDLHYGPKEEEERDIEPKGAHKVAWRGKPEPIPPTLADQLIQKDKKTP